MQHALHLVVRYVDGRSDALTWRNEEFRSQAERTQQADRAKEIVKGHAATVRQELHRASVQKPLTEKDREPGTKTKRGLVAKLLVTNVGRWIDGNRLSEGELHGSDGWKRLRELRGDYGWSIEERPNPEGYGRFQYRLAELPEEYR